MTASDVHVIIGRGIILDEGVDSRYLVDGVLPMGLGGRPTLLSGGLALVPAEAYHGARLRPVLTAC
jgi:hypothetical protein